MKRSISKIRYPKLSGHCKFCGALQCHKKHRTKIRDVKE
jgi:hypothetical protein